MSLCYLHPVAVECMEMILNYSASWSAESVADAKSLLSAITSPEFLAALIITNRIFSYTANITRSLQSKSRNIVEAISGIDVLCDTLQSVRDDVDTHHCRWMDETKKMCEDIGVDSASPDFVVDSNVVTTFQLEHQMNITNEILLFRCWIMS